MSSDGNVLVSSDVRSIRKLAARSFLLYSFITLAECTLGRGKRTASLTLHLYHVAHT